MTRSESVVVARVVFPTSAADAVLPLYIDGDASAAMVTGRHGVAIAPRGAVSLGSYFNAFPAAVWQAETDVATVRLRVRVDGHGTVVVHRSDADARTLEVSRHEIAGGATVEADLPLSGFEEGGAYWFDLVAADEGMSLLAADWSIEGVATATATIAMATFNRPVDCLAQLAVLAGDPGLDDALDRVVVVDQGTELVSEQPGFAEVEARLGERLVLMRQPNLGGSGGFSRGMLEALQRGTSSHVLLLDDDAISEPEAIVRAVRLADAARGPLIVGGGMLHLDDRSRLYAQSEQWDSRIGWVRLNRPGAYDHDFAGTPFRDASFFHRRHHSDFNGWWMCLVPVGLLRAAGLAMPVFLKGDDVEFGLRAAEHGVRTISPTGIALWHMGWGGKAPTRTWEAYFLHRNRLITELLHAPRTRPTGVLLHSFLGDVKPLLTLQYSAVRLRAQAIADVLAGPDPLPGWLATRAARIRELWQTYSDATPVTGLAAPDAGPAPARGPLRAALTLAGQFLRHMLVPVPARAAARPAVHLTAQSLSWSSFARIDSALVDTSDGRAVVWYRRDRRESARALWRSIRLHARLWWSWPRLARRFRDAAPELTAPASWTRVFEAS